MTTKKNEPWLCRFGIHRHQKYEEKTIIIRECTHKDCIKHQSKQDLKITCLECGAVRYRQYQGW